MMEIDESSFRAFLDYLKEQYQKTSGGQATVRLQEIDEQVAAFLATSNIQICEVYLDNTRIGIIGRERKLDYSPHSVTDVMSNVYTYQGIVPGYHNRGTGNSEVCLEFLISVSPRTSHRKDLHEIPFP